MDNKTQLDPQQTWAAVLGELQLQMTRATFDTWLKSTHAVAYEDGTFIVATHSGYAKDWLENQLLTLVKRTLTRVVGRAVEIKFIVRARPATEMDPGPLLARGGNGKLNNVTQDPGGLTGRYTFETFVVGPSNRMAHAAAMAVANRPAERYNPLFLYGGVGLGKTHLLHAIGHVPFRSGHRVVFVSTEEFPNDLVNAIRGHTTEEFRNKYRAADVLLIDDIQFIVGKESTQEEFFHTFNALYTSNRQIVMTSDRPPRAFTQLEQRLCSRFEWGLIADIQPPDFETRLAILRNKAEQQPQPVPEEVIEFLASKIRSNIRELEGALTRVLAYANLMSCPLTVATAQTALQDVMAPSAPPSLEVILNTVASFYRIDVEELVGRRRSQRIVFPRQVSMYLMHEEAGASLSQIGQMLGGRDHTTILHGCQKIATLVEENDQLRRDLFAIRELFQERVPH
jgi:chromosomal replication initiator protein